MTNEESAHPETSSGAEVLQPDDPVGDQDDCTYRPSLDGTWEQQHQYLSVQCSRFDDDYQPSIEATAPPAFEYASKLIAAACAMDKSIQSTLAIDDANAEPVENTVGSFFAALFTARNCIAGRATEFLDLMQAVEYGFDQLEDIRSGVDPAEQARIPLRFPLSIEVPSLAPYIQSIEDWITAVREATSVQGFRPHNWPKGAVRPSQSVLEARYLLVELAKALAAWEIMPDAVDRVTASFESATCADQRVPGADSGCPGDKNELMQNSGKAEDDEIADPLRDADTSTEDASQPSFEACSKCLASYFWRSSDDPTWRCEVCELPPDASVVAAQTGDGDKGKKRKIQAGWLVHRFFALPWKQIRTEVKERSKIDKGISQLGRDHVWYCTQVRGMKEVPKKPSGRRKKCADDGS